MLTSRQNAYSQVILSWYKRGLLLFSPNKTKQLANFIEAQSINPLGGNRITKRIYAYLYMLQYGLVWCAPHRQVANKNEISSAQLPPHDMHIAVHIFNLSYQQLHIPCRRMKSQPIHKRVEKSLRKYYPTGGFSPPGAGSADARENGLEGIITYASVNVWRSDVTTGQINIYMHVNIKPSKDKCVYFIVHNWSSFS